ncbi:MAG: endopeptidase La [Clostridiaceae bacterium]|nr:endopeptidase La [Clostridiaceae bacterium]
MYRQRKKEKVKILPLLPLRGLVVFPYVIMHFDVGRLKSIKALDEAMVNDQLIFLVTQKDARDDSPSENELYRVGTISKVKQLVKLPGDTIRVLIEGISRAEIREFVQTEPCFIAKAVEHEVSMDEGYEIEIEALKRRVMDSFGEYVKLSNKVTPDILLTISAVNDVGQMCDMIASSLFLKIEQKQEILNEFNPIYRMEKLLDILIKENEILEVERSINLKVRKQIDKMQKEYYLREQLKAIQSELGDRGGITGEVEDYRDKVDKANLPPDVEEKVQKELDRLLKLPPGSAEGGVIRTYVDWILDLPWNKKTLEVIDLKKAEDILNEDHYELKNVKDRIIEYLAVRKLTNSLKGPILCLVGPPGVGKTSIAKSIARALNRNYVRMSLGGIKDEAEIRGHRRTYVGAMPGRIISAMKQAGSMNPLILLDEIDKMSSDFRGDPASAMLEVLDGEQNFAFRDHYLEVPFDLSDVLFITTANNKDAIPRPLLDRMEIIEISGYTEEEKLNIAIKHLIPKQIKAHGLKKGNVIFDEQAIRDIIAYYTREAGVRNLEREIAAICRKTVRRIIGEKRKVIRVTAKSVEKYLGIKKFRHDKAAEKDEVGIAKGLAWTPVGGDTLSIEVNIMEGSGKLELTGQLGDVMKESARAAMSFIRSRVGDFNIARDFHTKYDIHVHVPEGAIPKDGPSAGITLATAIVSVLTGIPVKRNVAMTGEITLRGRILPVGGLKEKVLAAHRAGLDTIIVPADNKKDIEELPENIRGKIKIIYASDMDTVLNAAMTKKIGKAKYEPKSTEEHQKDIIMAGEQQIISCVEDKDQVM